MKAQHERFMKLAIDEAEKAEAISEVPVGALVVDARGNVLSRAHNRVISDCDPSSHAEAIAIRRAALEMQNYRLLNTTVYVTIEPCIMCMGMMIHARIKRLVFGAADPKWGAAGSLYNFGDDHRLNHSVEIISGICADQCQAVITGFFRSRREQAKKGRQSSSIT